MDTGAYKAGDYCQKRDVFMEKVQKLFKVAYRQASNMWKHSDARKALLKDMSVSELKRRRFIPAGATTNPFAVSMD